MNPYEGRQQESGYVPTPEQRRFLEEIYLEQKYPISLENRQKLGEIAQILSRDYPELALTPYERLMKSGQVSSESKARLQKLCESLNPVKLKNAIAAKLKRILKA